MLWVGANIWKAAGALGGAVATAIVTPMAVDWIDSGQADAGPPQPNPTAGRSSLPPAPVNRMITVRTQGDSPAPRKLAASCLALVRGKLRGTKAFDDIAVQYGWATWNSGGAACISRRRAGAAEHPDRQPDQPTGPSKATASVNRSAAGRRGS